jgi:hypothetical protein
MIMKKKKKKKKKKQKKNKKKIRNYGQPAVEVEEERVIEMVNAICSIVLCKYNTCTINANYILSNCLLYCTTILIVVFCISATQTRIAHLSRKLLICIIKP